jgi:hypothetical protein
MQSCAYVKNASRALGVKNSPQAGVACCLKLEGLASRLRDSCKALPCFYPACNYNQI